MRGFTSSQVDATFSVPDVSRTPPNQALEPTTLAVTSCAPSSTSRASQGRGSSLTLGTKQMAQSKIYAVCLLITIACWTCGVSYFISSCAIGGMAAAGKFDDSHYYVGAGGKSGPKTYTEVSRQTFEYSSIHGWVALVAFPIGAAAIIVANYISTREKMRLHSVERAFAASLTNNDKSA